jgi:hypothetical protein
MNQGNDPFEAGLRGLFPQPEEAFLNRLEVELVHQVAARGEMRWAKDRAQRMGGPFRRRSVSLALALILLAIIALFAIGPQRVLAQIRSLLAYVPGIGFTEAAEAYMLPAPVVETRAGVTLQVEQVLAEADRTIVVLNVEGLDPQEQEQYLYNSFLRLPDGKAVTQQGFNAELNQTTLVFGRLPQGVSQVDLVWSDNLARDWSQRPEQAWAIPLALKPARDLDSLKQAASYPLENARIAYEDMIIQVTGVSQGLDQTAICLELLWPANSGRMPFYIGRATLKDDLGTNYERIWDIPWDEQAQPIETVVPEAPTPGIYQSVHQILVFRPGVPSARSFTLTLDGITLREQVEADFTLDLGSSPQVGDHLPLDVGFEAAGVPLHINGARVVEAEIDNAGRTAGKQAALEFTLDPLPKDERRVVNWVNFRSPQISQYLSAGYSQDPATGIAVLRLPLGGDDGKGISGEIHVMGDWAEVVLPGQLTISWDAPKP